jgi:hypothetical protein
VIGRRSLFGAIALSPLMAVAAFAKEEVTGAPLSNSVNLTLHGVKKPDGEMMRLSDSSPIVFNVMPQYDLDKTVSLAVGDDGNLWLKRKDGQWKRVVTE